MPVYLQIFPCPHEDTNQKYSDHGSKTPEWDYQAVTHFISSIYAYFHDGEGHW